MNVWHSSARLLFFEQLESRLMMASDAAAQVAVVDQAPLTLITHGLGVPSNWPFDMGAAISTRLPTELRCTREQIAVSTIDTSGRINPNGCEHTLIVDWRAWSLIPGTADNDVVVADMVVTVDTLLQSSGRDLHVIGHSRGAYVNAELLRRLAVLHNYSLIDVQMTVLDAQAFGTDGELVVDPGGIVDFTDNYYQTVSGIFDPEGFPLDGAFNIDLSLVVAAWDGRPFNHSEPHDWYHWTIDTTDADGPELFDSGLPVLGEDGTATRTQVYPVSVWEEGAEVGYYWSKVGGSERPARPRRLRVPDLFFASVTADESARVFVRGSFVPQRSTLPSSVSFPVKVTWAHVRELSTGGAVAIVYYLPPDVQANSYWQWGPTADNPESHWHEFLFDGETGAVIEGNVVTVYYRDGARGDRGGLDGAVRAIGGPVFTTRPFHNYTNRLDVDGNGVVDREDAIAVVELLIVSGEPRRELAQFRDPEFGWVDVNGDGFLSYWDVNPILRALGFRPLLRRRGNVSLSLPALLQALRDFEPVPAGAALVDQVLTEWD